MLLYRRFFSIMFPFGFILHNNNSNRAKCQHFYGVTERRDDDKRKGAALRHARSNVLRLLSDRFYTNEKLLTVVKSYGQRTFVRSEGRNVIFRQNGFYITEHFSLVYEKIELCFRRTLGFFYRYVSCHRIASFFWFTFACQQVYLYYISRTWFQSSVCCQV